MTLKRFFRLGLIGLAIGVGLLLLVAGVAVWALHASRAQLDGSRPLAGLSAPAAIERDSQGVPTVRASSRLDAARALGFLHAQERFFQMDLLRRRGAGELAALFGSALVEHDREIRVHELRLAARASLALLPAPHHAVLDAYVEGVNAGLAALSVRPPEYLLLRLTPQPWQAEDSLLVGAAMALALQDASGSADRVREVVATALPPVAAKFFYPPASEWDAALDDSLLPMPAVPTPDEWDVSSPNRARAKTVIPSSATEDATREYLPEWIPGSNSWGVGGAFTRGGAILANDMHLDLGLPNTWYRAVMLYTTPGGTTRRLVGVTLPGVPSLIVGSNGDIAWGFTNSEVDTTDVVLLELDPRDPNHYRTPAGWRDLETIDSPLEVAHGATVPLRFQRSIWGPVIAGAHGSKRALSWVPQVPGGLNLGLLTLEETTTASDALALAPQCGVPVQNFLVGDGKGNLGWTLIGRVPKRVGYDGQLPVSWADGSRRWDGWLEPAEYPRREAARDTRLWTANQRILGTPGYLQLGPWTTDLGARARQIRDGLRALPAPVSEPDLMTLHRDDRALFLSRWQKLLLQTLQASNGGTNATRWKELRREVENWGGRAATISVGYRAVRGFRQKVFERVLEPVWQRCQALDTNRVYQVGRQEAPVWTLLQQRPAHLLNPRFAQYDALLADAAVAVLEDFQRQGLPIREATWGARIATRIQHPLGRALPALGRWLDLPSHQLPGDDHMPRVQGPRFGSSERLIVSPGEEEQGLFHMPGGQSGHFLSPFYTAGHEAWENVEPTPLLPGTTQYTLLLTP